MATINQLNPSLLDVAKTLDPEGPDGKVASVVELLQETNEILTDAVWVEGNMATGHRVTVRTGLPEVYWTLLNQGVPPSKSQTAQVDEGCAMLEALSEVDTRILKLNASAAGAFRLIEDSAFLEAMNQEQAETMFYGSPADPAKYVGLATRYSSTTAQNGKNILLAGGSGSDNCSIWLVGWGAGTTHGIFPKGSVAGFSVVDYGEDWTIDAQGGRYRVARTHYSWHCGLVVRDWRYNVRIANVDISDLQALSGTQALSASTSIIKLMSLAIDRIPFRSRAKLCFYAPREVLSRLRLLGLERNHGVLAVQQAINQFGQTIDTLTFLGVPVRAVDALLLNEAPVA
jgi:hypothetical protein